MSSFVVSDLTINRIVCGLDTYPNRLYYERIVGEVGFSIINKSGKERLGNALMDLNREAVNQRYPDADEIFSPCPYRFQQTIVGTLMITFKALKCWLYQCHEGNIPESQLFQAMDRICYQIASEIITRLSAYENSPGWE